MFKPSYQRLICSGAVARGRTAASRRMTYSGHTAASVFTNTTTVFSGTADIDAAPLQGDILNVCCKQLGTDTLDLQRPFEQIVKTVTHAQETAIGLIPHTRAV